MKRKIKRILSVFLSVFLIMEALCSVGLFDLIAVAEEQTEEIFESENLETEIEEIQNEEEEEKAEENLGEETEEETEEENESNEVSVPDLLTCTKDDVLNYIDSLGGVDSDAYYDFIDFIQTEEEYTLVWISQYGVDSDCINDLYGYDLDSMTDDDLMGLMNSFTEDDFYDFVYCMTFTQYQRYANLKRNASEEEESDPGMYREFSSSFAYDSESPYEDETWSFGVKRHILTNINRDLVPEINKFAIADILDYRTSYVKSAAWNDRNGDGSVNLFDVLPYEGYEGNIYTDYFYTYFYELSEDAPYYVAYLPANHDSDYPIGEFDIVVNNNAGQILPAAHFYDSENALLYVEKSWFDATHSVGNYGSVRTQTVFVSGNADMFNVNRRVPVTVSVNTDERIPDGLFDSLHQGYAYEGILDGILNVQIVSDEKYAKMIGANNITVYINGIEYDKYTYHASTGTLSLGFPSNSISDVHVTIHGFSDAEKGIMPLDIDSICNTVTGNLFGKVDVDYTKIPTVGQKITFGYSRFAKGDSDANTTGVGANMIAVTYTPTASEGPEAVWQLYDWKDSTHSFHYMAGLGNVIASIPTDSQAVLDYLSDKSTDPRYGFGDPQVSTYKYGVSGEIYADGVKFAEVPADVFVYMACTHVSIPDAVNSGLRDIAEGMANDDAGTPWTDELSGVVVKTVAPDSSGTGYIYIAIGSNVYANLRNDYAQAQFGIGRIEYHTEVPPATGYLQLRKVSSNTGITNGNGNYSVEGIRFDIYDSEGNFVTTLTTDVNGYTEKLEVTAGTYKAYEVISSATERGWTGTDNPLEITVSVDNTVDAPALKDFENTPMVGYLKVQKLSGNTGITSGNSCYKFTGIQFKVYTDSGCTVEAKGSDGQTHTLTAKADGWTDAVSYPFGTYYVREVESSLSGTGYSYNRTAKEVKVTSGNTTQTSAATAEITNTPNSDPIGILLSKADSKTNTDGRRVG